VAHSNDDPPALPAHLAALEPAVRRALAKDPAERYPSAGDFARALSAAVAGRPVATPERTVARGDAAPNGATEPLTPPTGVVDDSPTQQRGGTPPGREGRRVLILCGLVLGAIAIVVVVVTLASGGGSSGAHDALDAKTLSVSSVPVHGDPQGIAVGEGSVWVADHDHGTILQLDPRDGSSEGAPINVADQPSAIATGGGYVWAIVGNNAVTRVDPDSREVTGTPVKLDGISPADIEFGEGYVWVLESGDVVQIDPDKLAVKKKYAISPTGEDIAVGDGVVLVPGENIEAGQSRIDVAGGHVNTGGAPLTGSVANGFGSAWSYGDDSPNGSRVLKLDPHSGKQLGITRFDGGSGVIATGAGAVWILDTSNGRLTRIDPKTSKIAGTQTAVTAGSDSRLAIGDDAAWITSSDSVTRIGF